ncbi:hypothetical protein [Roseomonas indoligenes]|uniref:Uncharacterized protein n=1 Tax=Roseomonas indoligenes TaxID=2820811 RepID=A0A940MUL8_9PROT|nr:hypothetical protein [Pararoseomonas indoligenes]MBP0494433.1 hypothetical protein [Pararoseomonas indoligenes]
MSSESPKTSSGTPYEGAAEEQALRETGGWRHGLRPGIGQGGELDKAAAEGAPEADPATRAPIPGFVDQPDATEAFVEGEGVSQARNAVEDLPRQG